MTDRTTAIGVEIDAAPRRSAVSWGAVLAGALVAIAVTLALLVLGSGLGLTLVSPWWEANAAATTIAVSTIAWLVVMQWASAGLGGYLTGRLRNRWTVNSDEVFFRDTAHGLLMWAVATIIMAGLASHSVIGIVGAGTQAVGQVAGGAAMGAAQEAAESATDPTAYFVDSLYRPADAGASTESPASPTPAPSTQSAPTTTAPTGGVPSAPSLAAPSRPSPVAAASDRGDLRGETMRIIVRGMAGETFPEADRAYLVQRVAAETGMSTEEADARVTEVLQGLKEAKADAQAAAEQAREAAVMLAIVAFISLLVGAFIGAVAAALGGSHRDDVPDRAIVG